MKRFFPNIITLLNLVSGVFAVILGMQDFSLLPISAFLIILAGLFDFLDGFTARLLGVSSELGKELDSLSDLISFGFAPSVLVFRLIDWGSGIFWMPYLSLIIVPFSALRLAKFNIDTEQIAEFRGLPTPALALFFVGICLSFFYQAYIWNAWLLLILSWIFSFLLITRLPMFSLKFRNYSLKNNVLRYSFLLISFVLLLIFKFLGISLIILFYILLSIVYVLIRK